MALKRLLVESFQDLPWMPRVAPIFNAAVDELTRLENKNIQIAAHVDGEIRNFMIDGVYPLELSWNRNNKPTLIIIGAVSRVDSVASGLTVAPYVDWEFNNKGQIKINNVVGITATSAIKWNISTLILTK